MKHWKWVHNKHNWHYFSYHWYIIFLLVNIIFHCDVPFLIKVSCMSTTQTYLHYNDVIMGMIASQITSLTIVYSIVYSDTDQRKHQSSASLAFVWGIPQGLVNSPHKWPVPRKVFPFDDVIMNHVNQQGIFYLLKLTDIITHPFKLGHVLVIISYILYAWYLIVRAVPGNICD